MDIAKAQLDQDKEHREHERQLKEQEIKLRQDEADASRKSHQEFMSAILAVVGPGSQAGAAGPVCQMDQNQVRDIVHGPPSDSHQLPLDWLITTICAGCQHKACMHSKPPTA